MIKRSKAILAFLFVMFFMLLPISVAALGYDDFTTRALSEQEIEEYLAQRKSREFLIADTQSGNFQTFSVSEGGLVALLFDTGDNLVIHVYNADGTFRYGYRLVDTGAEDIFFAGENLAIYTVRGKHIETFDSMGNTIAVHQTFHVNDHHIRELALLPETGTIGDSIYYAQKDFIFLNSYSRFVVEDTNGNPIVVYEAPGNKWVRLLIPLILILLLLSGFSALVYQQKRIDEESDRTI